MHLFPPPPGQAPPNAGDCPGLSVNAGAHTRASTRSVPARTPGVLHLPPGWKRGPHPSPARDREAGPDSLSSSCPAKEEEGKLEGKGGSGTWRFYTF